MSQTTSISSIQRQKYYMRLLENVRQVLITWEKNDAKLRRETFIGDVNRLRALNRLIAIENARLKRM